LGNSGTVGYTITATGGFTGSATGSVTLAPSGFVLSGPFGLGANFFTTTGGLPSQIDVFSALLDVNGNPVFDTFGNLVSQPLAGGTSVSVNVTSSVHTVGTITTTPLVFTGANDDVSTSFTPLGAGTTVLAAVAPSGYTTPASLASLDATVSTPAIQINTGTGVVGQNLEQLVTLNLGSPAPASGLQVTLSSNNTGSLAFSSTATGAGTSGLTLTIPATQFTTTFYVYGLNSLGTVNITASASGYTSGSGSISLAPSGIVIDPSFNVQGIPFSVSLAGGTVSIPVQTAVLNPSSSAFANTQSLAGGLTVSVSLTNSNNTAGTIVSPLTITGGSSGGNLQFTPVTAGPACQITSPGSNCTIISAQRPLGGWQLPSTDSTFFVGVTH
jgi:trimeric autotransporter adhesin